MQNHAAVFRDSKTLKEGCDKLDDLYTEMKENVKVCAQDLWSIIKWEGKNVNGLFYHLQCTVLLYLNCNFTKISDILL